MVLIKHYLPTATSIGSSYGNRIVTYGTYGRYHVRIKSPNFSAENFTYLFISFYLYYLGRVIFIITTLLRNQVYFNELCILLCHNPFAHFYIFIFENVIKFKILNDVYNYIYV